MILIENVTKEYATKKGKKVRVLDDVNLQIAKGEVIALLGHNGSGKSTLIKCICGVIKTTEGKILIEEKDVFKKRKQLVKKMGIVFNQKPSFIVDLSVSDNLKFFKSIYNISDDKFQENINFLDGYLNFSHLLEKPYRKLSFGERVKCEIVSVLLHSPKYIFLDEPTIGLDYMAKKGLYELIAEYKKQGCSIIISTHEVDYIEGVCDRALILKNGKVCFVGNPRNVTDRVDKRKRMSVTYSEIMDSEQAQALECNIMKKNVEEKRLEFLVDDNMDLKSLISRVMDAYQIQSLDFEEASVREVLEDVLKESI